jgi:hypothetical protein
MRRLIPILALVAIALQLVSSEPAADPRMKGAYRKPDSNGWIYVHLEGKPAEAGFQHGWLLAPEIEDLYKVTVLNSTHDSDKDWRFFRNVAEKILWPHIEQEYREELQGITDGVRARGVKLDLWDVVAVNAFIELGYYVSWYDKQRGVTPPPSATAPDRCSAFVATGSYTKDGRVVIAHNNWSGYLEGARWNIVFDIVPARGRRFLMDGLPGFIHSGDDFGVNAAGIMITETTITQFSGFDPNGIPEFVRARKAMQYSESIDDFARIMKEGNNGGYANNWLVADRKTNEIASLELGLKNVNLWRTKDGYYAGANFPVDEKLAREETAFDLKNSGLSANARRARWRTLLAESRGKIDVAAGQRFLADHYDTHARKEEPNERTLCGHIDLSPRGSKPWQPEYGAGGTVQSKVADAAMAEEMSFIAAMGHPCGLHFKAADHLKRHPQFDWMKPLLRDLDSRPWTVFRASR